MSDSQGRSTPVASTGMTTRRKILIGLIATVVAVVAGVTIGLMAWSNALVEDTQPAQADDVSAARDQPDEASDTSSGAVFEDPSTSGFYGEVPEGLESSILLTDSEVAILEETVTLTEQGVESSETYGEAKVIYDDKLVPVMNAVVTALLGNGGSAEGLNFSSVLNDQNTISQWEELVAPYVQYGTQEEQLLQLCETRTNDDGRNFCGVLQASAINLNENIVWDIYAQNAGNAIQNQGDEVALTTAMQPRLYGNKLIVATDGAIRSDF